MKYLLILLVVISGINLSFAQSSYTPARFTMHLGTNTLSTLTKTGIGYNQDQSTSDLTNFTSDHMIAQLTFSDASAKQNKSLKKQTPEQARHHQILNGLLQQQNNKNEAQKTTAGIAGERVIAQSRRDNTFGSLNDSFRLYYGANKGSTYDYNTMIYPYNYPYSTSPMFNYAGIFTKRQILFDTLMHWTVDGNTLVYGYYETDIATYDVHQNTTTYKSSFFDSAIYANRNFTNKFNSAYNIDTAYGYNYIAGVADSAFKQFFSYNALHKIVEDSTYEYHLGVWRIASKSYYNYDDVSGDLIEIDNYGNNTDTSFLLPLIEQLQYNNTYDASHRLITVASGYYNGTTFGPYVRDTFAYTGANTWHSSWKEYQYDPINMYWAPMFNMTKVLNLSGKPDTVNIQGYDSLLIAWVPQTMDVIHYNTFKDPDTLEEYDYNFTAFPATPSFTTTYYYQLYTNAAETNPVSTVADDAIIFPNPVADQFTIAHLNAASGARVSASVFNAAGQIISKETFGWQGQKQIETHNLLPGIYWVLIQDETGNTLHRQAIVKQ